MLNPVISLISARTRSIPHERVEDCLTYVSGLVIEFNGGEVLPAIEIRKHDKEILIPLGEGSIKTAAIAVISTCIKDIEQALDSKDEKAAFTMQHAIISTINEHHSNAKKKVARFMADLQ